VGALSWSAAARTTRDDQAQTEVHAKIVVIGGRIIIVT
jgi:hypothetical protein